MLRKVLMLVLILLLGALLVVAQEELPNDPTVNEDANACNEGGAMEGKCNVDFNEDGVVDEFELAWAWECGWYIIRLDAGIFSEIPERCQVLIAAEVPDEGGEEDTRFLCVQQVTDVHFQVWDTFGDGHINDGSSERVGGETTNPPKLPPCIDDSL